LGRKPAGNVHWRKSTDEREGQLEQKFDVAFGTNFRISKDFQRSKQKLYLVSSLTGQGKKFKNHLLFCACTESTDLILWTFLKNIHVVIHSL
jgi:hypothetical protein